jgi:hypothetical protein
MNEEVETGRTKAFYIRKIIEDHLEDMEDYFLAAQPRGWGFICIHKVVFRTYPNGSVLKGTINCVFPGNAWPLFSGLSVS